MVYQMWALVYCMLEDNQLHEKLFWKYFKVHIHHMRNWKKCRSPVAQLVERCLTVWCEKSRGRS